MKSLLCVLLSFSIFCVLSCDFFIDSDKKSSKSSESSVEDELIYKNSYLSILDSTTWEISSEIVLNNEYEYAALKTDKNNFIYLAGSRNYKDKEKKDVHLFKLSSQGLVEWEELYDFDFGDVATSIGISNTGHCIIGGTSLIYNERKHTRMLFFNVDQFGSFQWHHAEKIDASFWDTRSVYVTRDGGYIAVADRIDDADDYLFETDLSATNIIYYSADGERIWSSSTDGIADIANIIEVLPGVFTVMITDDSETYTFTIDNTLSGDDNYPSVSSANKFRDTIGFDSLYINSGHILLHGKNKKTDVFSIKKLDSNRKKIWSVEYVHMFDNGYVYPVIASKLLALEDAYVSLLSYGAGSNKQVLLKHSLEGELLCSREWSDRSIIDVDVINNNIIVLETEE